MAESIAGGGEDDVRDRTPTLSVVVITHNEQERIASCLESVFDATDSLEDVEVVLVDSRSTDDTVERAREYPVTILRLPEDPPVTPSAGRYVGTAATTGDLVLFVDGDMVLEEGWLPDACRTVRETPGLAGVDGRLAAGGDKETEANEETETSDAAEPDEESERGEETEANEAAVRNAESIDVLRGVALYERAALASVGGFDPFLNSMEDIDLSFRLDAAGYDLRRVDEVVASHPPRNAEGERARRWRRGYYHGRGELFRKYLARPRLFARLAYRTRLFLGPLAWLSVAPMAAKAGGKRGLAAWSLATVAGLAGVVHAQGADWTVDKLVATGPVLAGTALGFSVDWPSPSEYPLDDVETVQRAPNGSETEAVAAT